MSDKEITMELLKALVASGTDIVRSDTNETDRDISLGTARVLSEMYEIIYNKVHSLKADVSNT